MAKKTWKETLGYNTVSAVKSPVAGVEQSFYPVSVAMAFELRMLAKPIAKAIAGLFGKHDNDISKTTRNVKTVGDTGGGQEISEFIQQGIDPKLAEMRSSETTAAIESLFEAVSTPATQEVIAKLVMDSLRDVFDRVDAPGQPITFSDAGHAVTPRDFLQNTPTPLLYDYCIGIFNANKKVLGPFAALAEAKVKTLSAPGSQDTPPKSQPAAPSPTPENSPPANSETPTTPTTPPN